VCRIQLPVNEPVQEQSQSISRLLGTSLRIYLEDIFVTGLPVVILVCPSPLVEDPYEQGVIPLYNGQYDVSPHGLDRRICQNP
jgi:hypothetical protein